MIMGLPRREFYIVLAVGSVLFASLLAYKVAGLFTTYREVHTISATAKNVFGTLDGMNKRDHELDMERERNERVRLQLERDQQRLRAEQLSSQYSPPSGGIPTDYKPTGQP